MLKIRRGQFQVLRRAFHEGVEDRLVAHARTIWTDVSEEALRRIAREAVERCWEYGIGSEQGFSRWVDLMLAFGSEFDRSDRTPWAREILAHPGLSADEKVDRLWHQAKQALRRERDSQRFDAADR